MPYITEVVTMHNIGIIPEAHHHFVLIDNVAHLRKQRISDAPIIHASGTQIFHFLRICRNLDDFQRISFNVSKDLTLDLIDNTMTALSDTFSYFPSRPAFYVHDLRTTLFS